MPTLTQITEACWAVFIAVWAISWFRAKASVRRPMTGPNMLWRLAVLAIVVILYQGLKSGWLPRPQPFPYGVQLAGVVITVLGVAFAIWARFTLGRNWGMPMTLREQPDLVTGGPYAFVRHPIYTGIIFAMLGTGLTFGAWYFFVLVIAFGYFLISTQREEKDMTAHFPDAYPAYKARTKRLIPFVY